MDKDLRKKLVDKYIERGVYEIKHVLMQAISDAYNQGFEDGVEWANDKAINFKPE